jgi:hypothetical protein
MDDFGTTVRASAAHWRSFMERIPSLEEIPQDEQGARRLIYYWFDYTLLQRGRAEDGLRRKFGFWPPVMLWDRPLLPVRRARNRPRWASLSEERREEFNLLCAQHEWCDRVLTAILVAWDKARREQAPAVELASRIRSRHGELARELLPELRYTFVCVQNGSDQGHLDAAGFVYAHSKMSPRLRAGLQSEGPPGEVLAERLPGAVAEAMAARGPDEPWDNVVPRTMRLIASELSGKFRGQPHKSLAHRYQVKPAW